MSDYLTMQGSFYPLSKRELIAAMAMQGMMANNSSLWSDNQDLAQQSVEAADALIKALEEKIDAEV